LLLKSEISDDCSDLPGNKSEFPPLRRRIYWELVPSEQNKGNPQGSPIRNQSATLRENLMKPFLILTLPALIACTSSAFADDDLIAHWKLTENARDSSGNDHHAINHGGVTFADGEGAAFDGIDAWLEIPADRAPKFGTKPFTIAAWIHTDEDLDDVLGDIMSCFDPETRNGFNFGLMNYAGVTSAQSNWRNVFFGIDAAKGGEEWIDCGRPGTNQQIESLVVFDGELYASTWEPGENDRGHVYRYAGGEEWIDCGAPDPANAIKGMAVYKGRLYAGSELYSGGGSSLPLSPNENHGGRVYRYEGGTEWTDCGKVADVRSISGLAVFNGKLYAGTGTTGAWRDKPRTRGMYRFDGIGKWTDCGCPDLRVTHLGVHNGSLFGLSYDDGGFFRYQGGTDWERLGPVPETTQVYSMMIYEGSVHVGTWPTGSVFRFDPDGPQKWTHAGRLGEEKEVMAVSVYNGKFYAGTLPMADVYRYDGESRWTHVGQLDDTPDVKYRRAWSMAVFDGKLFCGVLPSGHVHSLEAGKAVTYDQQLLAGWRHLAAVRGDDRLQLYVDGKLVSESAAFDSNAWELHPDKPLKIGFGQHDYFNGRMKELRLYGSALSAKQIEKLQEESK
jgi:hypothetical protein